MKKKQKYYVVWKGVNPGVYNDWEIAKQQVSGYVGASYKAFDTKEEAFDAYNNKPSVKKENKKAFGIKLPSICVDAACSGNPGDMEYRGVETATGKQIFHKGPFPLGTNNIGEFLALVHAIALLKQKQLNEYVIYTDSKTAIAWVRNKKAKTTLEKNSINQPIFELIDRAEMWLHQNTPSNTIIHWDTVAWGEIPADFGRK